MMQRPRWGNPWVFLQKKFLPKSLFETTFVLTLVRIATVVNVRGDGRKQEIAEYAGRPR